MRVQELSQLEGTLVMHDSWVYGELLRHYGLSVSQDIFDVNQYRKFMVGRPKSDFSRAKPWDTLSIVSGETNAPMSNEKFWAFLWSGDGDNDAATIETSELFLNALEQQFVDAQCLRETRAKGFFEVEVPLQQVLLNRQVEGIKLDSAMVSKNMADLDAEYFGLLAELREKHRYRGDLFDTSYLYDYIRETQLDLIFDFGMASVDRELQYLSAFSRPIEVLRNLRRLQLTKSALSKISEPNQDRVHPVFDAIGSVTGRINVIEPLIQQLKKRYRSNFVADDDHELVYVDYASFEPRILASLSSDAYLDELLRTEDFYTSLCELLGLVPEQRSGAKSIFLQYMYGAADSTMASYLRKLGPTGGQPTQKIQDFKASFEQVEAWKESIGTRNHEEDFVSVGHGIVREIRHSPNGETIASRRIINHLIQGAGASLLKLLILKIRNDHPEFHMLLPMHDALLLQLPSEDVEESKAALKNLLTTHFNETFETELGQVSFKQF
jgi:DNA polymerase I-like protein with 3'-5' exonuclease and polymerase domains